MSAVGVTLSKGTCILTFTGVGVADEHIEIGSNVYTFKAAPATTAGNVDIKTDETTQAAGLVNAINVDGTVADYGSDSVAHPLVVATSAAGVVTLTAKVAGTQFNHMFFAMVAATNGTNIAAGSVADSASVVVGVGDVQAWKAAGLTGLLEPKAKTINFLHELC